MAEVLWLEGRIHGAELNLQQVDSRSLYLSTNKNYFFHFKSCEQFLATSFVVRFSMFIEVGGF